MALPPPSQAGTRQNQSSLVKCGVCGTESRQPVFRAQPPEQAPDLDLRPGEPVRGTMRRWLQECPNCGYAAPDLAQAHPAVPMVIAAAPFRALRADGGTPPLARRFLSWAHVLEETGALHAAAEATLHAAWVADDLGHDELARQWRLDAVALWRGGPPMETEQKVRSLDALRRAGVWDDAAATAAAMAEEGITGPVAQVIALEARLIAGFDAGRHTVASALPPPARRPHVTHGKTRRGLGDGAFGWLRRLFRR
ncbi:hypothetical protein C8P66_11191 [Humitalea rosea]|uniref:DUF2225 domain-containing protein n=1 Tax=Humitalea rosea TaxID=990373 RepID=A0A2W7IGF6_9PROT|nr:hypothetical protein [Humitalea rosea]PZW45676.1 hypothetical protein C8P66_11191 [Humitalea rosea]